MNSNSSILWKSTSPEYLARLRVRIPDKRPGTYLESFVPGIEYGKEVIPGLGALFFRNYVIRFHGKYSCLPEGLGIKRLFAEDFKATPLQQKTHSLNPSMSTIIQTEIEIAGIFVCVTVAYEPLSYLNIPGCLFVLRIPFRFVEGDVWLQVITFLDFHLPVYLLILLSFLGKTSVSFVWLLCFNCFPEMRLTDTQMCNF